MSAGEIIGDGLAQLRAELLRRAIGEQATLGEALDLAREAWLFVLDGDAGATQTDAAIDQLADDFKTIASQADAGASQPSPHLVEPRSREERLATGAQGKAPAAPALIGGPGRKAWSQEEDGRLVEMRRKGLTGAEMAAALDRPQSSIWSRIDKLEERGLLTKRIGSIAGDQYKIKR